MPITTRPKKKTDKVDDSAKSGAERIVGDPFEFVTDDNVKKALSPVIGKGKKKGAVKNKVAKGQTSVTASDANIPVIEKPKKQGGSSRKPTIPSPVYCLLMGGIRLGKAGGKK